MTFKLCIFSEIVTQYKDFWHRAKRLESAYKAYVSDNKTPPINDITTEDMTIYINWLSWKLNSSRLVHRYLLVRAD